MKLLQLAFVDTSFGQILRKIDQQFTVLRRLNPESHCCVIGINSQRIGLERFSFNYIDLSHENHAITREKYLNACKKSVEHYKPDIVYFRYPFFDSYALDFVRTYDNVVFENQTIAEFEFADDVAEIEKKYGPLVLSKSRGIVAVTKEILNYELNRAIVSPPGHVMANGIDVNSIPIIDHKHEGNEINILCAAHFSYWHGIDRLINGLSQYDMRPSVILHLVGHGAEINRYIELTKKSNLERHIKLYGFLEDEKLTQIAKLCDIGVGPLAIHRKGISESCSLKTREYCLRGLPFIYSGKDVDFDATLPFVRQIPSTDEPIDISKIVDFARIIKRDPQIRYQERKYAIENLSWDQKVEGLLKFLKTLVHRSRLKFSLPAVPGNFKQECNLDSQQMNSNDISEVSIIIPCYNQAEFLPDALKSVIKQTFCNWECIIVNDGSPDNTSEVATQLIKSYPEHHIKLVEKQNGGLVSARNAGVEASGGKYILPLDADDKIAPDMLAKTVKILETRPEVAIAYTDVQEFGSKSRMVPSIDYDFAKLCVMNYIVASALYRREAWEKVGGYNLKMNRGYEDWDFWIACGEHGYFGHRIPEPLFLYRKSEGSMYHTNSAQNDKQLKAQIILNHPSLYSPKQLNWAELVKKNNAEALAIESGAYIPVFDDFKPATPFTLLRNEKSSHQEPALCSKRDLKSNFDILFTMYGWLEEGGGTILPRQIARAFARRGHRMTVVYSASQNLPDQPPYYVKESEEEDVRLIGIYNRPASLCDLQNPEREIEDPNIRKIITGIIDETKPDIVHYHNLVTLSMSVAEEVRRRGIPSVYTSHNYWLLCPRLYLFKQDLSLCDGPSPDGSKCAACTGQQNKQHDYARRFEQGRKLIDWCTDRHLAVSHRLRELFIKNGHSAERIYVLQQQAETGDDIWRQVGSSRTFASAFPKPIKMGFIGSLLPQKGVHILLDAMQSISASEAECHIFGSGPESYVKFLRKQANNGVICFHGRYETNQLPNILKKLDIIVVPSIWEDCAPLVVAEALAARCPVIGSRIGGIPDFIDDEINGLLFKPGNAKDLNRILTRIINDPGLLAKLQNNIQAPKGFDTYLDELVDHYSEVTGEQKRRRRGAKVNSAPSLTAERTLLMTERASSANLNRSKK